MQLRSEDSRVFEEAQEKQAGRGIALIRVELPFYSSYPNQYRLVEDLFCPALTYPSACYRSDLPQVAATSGGKQIWFNVHTAP